MHQNVALVQDTLGVVHVILTMDETVNLEELATDV